MKFILLAAAAVIAAPAIAQDQTMTPPADQTMPAPTPTPDASMPADDTMSAPDSTMSTPDTAAPTTAMPQQPPMAGDAPMATGGDSSMADPAGGYQPSAPPLQGTPAPGTTVRFQQAPTPDQAYPAPAPMAKYPICKKGQYDNCMQRGGR